MPILEAPTSFTNQDFTSIFLELSLLYNVLRQAKSSHIARVAAPPYPGNETLCRFDCEMATAISSSLVFWVHPDNVVEIKVALLKNLGLVSDDSVAPLSKTPSSSSMTDNSNNKVATPTAVTTTPTQNKTQKAEIENAAAAQTNSYTGNDAATNTTINTRGTESNITNTNNSNDTHERDLTFAIYLDNPKKFNSIQTQSEPGQIRWVGSSSAITNSSHVLCSPVGGLRYFCLASLTSKQSDYILHAHFESLAKAIAAQSPSPLQAANNLSRLALSWVEKRKASPISKACFNRARYRYIKPKNAATTQSSSSGSALPAQQQQEQQLQKSPPLLTVASSLASSTDAFSSSFGMGTPSSAGANPNTALNSSKVFSTSPTSSMDVSDIWATLDSNIKIIKTLPLDDKSSSILNYSDIPDTEAAQEFPFSVLEVRYKGMDKPAWLAELEKSHLVYPVSGFSLYSHSVASFYSDSLSQLPSWLKILEDGSDIRRTPKRNTASNQSNSTTSLLNGTSTSSALTASGARQGGAAAGTIGGGPSPGILLNNERDSLLRNADGPNTRYTDDEYTSDKHGLQNAQQQQGVSPQSPPQESNQPVVRYWNEFDDPEDDHDAGVFVIIPDDDDEHGGVFSEQNVARLMHLSDIVWKKAHHVKHRIARFFGLSSRNGDDEDSDSYDEDSDDYYYYNSQGVLPTIYEEVEEDDDDDDDEDDDDEDEFGEDAFYASRLKSQGTGSGRSYGYGPETGGQGVSSYYTPSRSSRHGRGPGGQDSDGHPRGARYDEEADYYSFGGYSGYTALEQRDYILSVLYSLCFALSTLLVVILFGVILGEDLTGISTATFSAIICGLAVSLGICLLGMSLFLMRSQFPSGIHQTLVYLTFFSIICLGVGGVVWIIS